VRVDVLILIKSVLLVSVIALSVMAPCHGLDWPEKTTQKTNTLAYFRSLSDEEKENF